ncbi:hypothetical protein FOMPIDRAFT_1016547 [Fomitopsis schrenkii]|uniref:Uncharacterized protein n=1 Tax=Fomitopsis schrenkii TaxID=2126942 RepID=S8FFM8_FOMSC|nr:hypothetical protein FOMPIDRAFT_1016547 [Fomitopsis schrenkii]
MFHSSTVQFPDSLSDELVAETAGFSFAYLKEMLMSSLVLKANPKYTTTSFGDVEKGQIKDLQAQMEKAKSQVAVHPLSPSQGTGSAFNAAVQMVQLSTVAMPRQPAFIS